MKYAPSHANFVFFQTGRPVQEFNKAMADKGVIVGRAFPPLLDWCRVSTGTEEEVGRFVRALEFVRKG